MKKKILIYNGQLFMGGIERILTTFLKELIKRDGVEVELLIKENDPQKNVFESEVPKGIKINYIKTAEMVEKREKLSEKKKKNSIYRLLYALALKNERKYMKGWIKEYFNDREDIDVVIDFDMSLGKYLDVIPQKKMGWVHYTLSEKKGKKKKRYEERLKKYDGIAVICDEMKKEMKEFFQFAYEKTERIYNPFLIDEIRERSEDEENLTVEERKMLSKDYIIGVSRLTSGKGREDLIKAFSILKKNGYKEKLYILGEGAEKERLKKLITELKLEEEAFLVGQKQNPYVWMRNAKVLAHTSFGEGFANILVEAMACGTPCIAYDCKVGPKDVLGGGEFGPIVDVGDVEGFAKELSTLLGDDKEINKYKEKLSERTEIFSAKKSTDDLLKMIEKL